MPFLLKNRGDHYITVDIGIQEVTIKARAIVGPFPDGDWNPGLQKFRRAGVLEKIQQETADPYKKRVSVPVLHKQQVTDTDGEDEQVEEL